MLQVGNSVYEQRRSRFQMEQLNNGCKLKRSSVLRAQMAASVESRQLHVRGVGVFVNVFRTLLYDDRLYLTSKAKIGVHAVPRRRDCDSFIPHPTPSNRRYLRLWKAHRPLFSSGLDGVHQIAAAPDTLCSQPIGAGVVEGFMLGLLDARTESGECGKY